jgi:sugar phosphate isomerase/epimerase
MLSIATDYVRGHGCPEPYLRAIAEAGISYIHWTHHFNTDFLYLDCEVEQVAQWLTDYGLRVNDLHASAGVEKRWMSFKEYERLAGVELVKNRIGMTARLGSDVVVLHLPCEPEDPGANEIFWGQVHRSLEAVEPYAREHGVRIALENLYPDNWHTLERVFSDYSPDYVGLCYDSGHGNLKDWSDGLGHLDRLKDHLISLHLNDNDGSGDQHKPLFLGTVDFDRLARIIAQSPYSKCTNMEITIHHSGIKDERAFLDKAIETGTTFSRMVNEFRAGR